MDLPVTVVIPAYRRPRMVERAVRSVLSQTLRPDEIVVVDDASGDETGERAAQLGARVITHETNQGEGGARNTGLAAAKHDWVALLDSDDEWLPEHLATVWAARNGHALVGTAALALSDGEQAHRIQGWAGRRPRVLRSPAEVALPENKLPPSSVLLRRDAVLAAGGFPTGMPRAGDLDTWIRVLERGTGIALPTATILYHMHAGQVSASQEHMWSAHRSVLDAYEGRDWCTPAVRRRHEGIVAWDEARAALSEGSPRVSTLARLARAVADPERAIGLAQLLETRFWQRRRATSVTRSGSASVAVLRGAATRASDGAVDLRDRSLAGAAVHLFRHPTASALVPGRVSAIVMKALGIEPITHPELPREAPKSAIPTRDDG